MKLEVLIMKNQINWRTLERPHGVEERALVGANLRAESQGDEMALTGYAASFNVLSQDLGGFRERIAPRAFSLSLASNPDVKCLLNHDPNYVLGRTKSGTLAIAEDDRGLKFRCQLDKNQSMHRDLHAAIKRGDLDQCSFAFKVPDGGDDWDEAEEDGVPFVRRTVRNCSLMDISAVCYPAYNAPGATVVAARKLGLSTDAARRARCAEIGEIIRQQRIAEAGRNVAEDLVWLRRMNEIPGKQR
jgi:HK97 family phage prohead protease